MAEEGFTFFLSANKVWLTKTVPLDYLRRESNDGSDLNDIIEKLRNHNSFSDEDENNTIWSITAELFGLDYSNSEYNPLKDERCITAAQAVRMQEIRSQRSRRSKIFLNTKI